MPKPNSQQKNFEATILGWPKRAWNSLSEKYKLEIWKEVYKKQTPDKLELGGIGGGPIRLVFRAAANLPEPKAG